MLAILVLLQAAAPDPVTALREPSQCGRASASGEVVVCGRRGDSPYRLKQLANPWAKKGDRTASIDIPGVGRLSAEAEQVGGPPGASSPAAMARLKIRF